MLDGEHADRAFEPDDRNSGEAVEALLARLGLVGEGGVLGGFGQVEDATLGGDGADLPGVADRPEPVDLGAGRTATAIRSTTWSSFNCAEPRLAMTSCRPVRISRAAAAAEAGMRLRYQKRGRRVTRDGGLVGVLMFAMVESGRYWPTR